MADIVIGRLLDRLKILIIQNSQQAFALAWTNPDGSPADISSLSFSIVLDTQVPLTWIATKTGNNTTWTLSQTESNLPTGFYAGKLYAGAAVAYAVSVEVQ